MKWAQKIVYRAGNTVTSMTKVTEEKPGLTGEVVESWSEPFPEEGDSIDAPGGAGQARWLRRRSRQ